MNLIYLHHILIILIKIQNSKLQKIKILMIEILFNNNNNNKKKRKQKIIKKNKEKMKFNKFKNNSKLLRIIKII